MQLEARVEVSNWRLTLRYGRPASQSVFMHRDLGCAARLTAALAQICALGQRMSVSFPLPSSLRVSTRQFPPRKRSQWPGEVCKLLPPLRTENDSRHDRKWSREVECAVPISVQADVTANMSRSFYLAKAIAGSQSESLPGWVGRKTFVQGVGSLLPFPLPLPQPDASVRQWEAGARVLFLPSHASVRAFECSERHAIDTWTHAQGLRRTKRSTNRGKRVLTFIRLKVSGTGNRTPSSADLMVGMTF